MGISIFVSCDPTFDKKNGIFFQSARMSLEYQTGSCLKPITITLFFGFLQMGSLCIPLKGIYIYTMEASSPTWFSDTELLELPNIVPTWEMSSLDNFTGEQQLWVDFHQSLPSESEMSSLDNFTGEQQLWVDFHQSLPSESYNSYPPFIPPPNTTSDTINGSPVEASNMPAKLKSSKRSILSFGNPDSPNSSFYASFVGEDGNPREVVEVLAYRGSKRSSVTMAEQAPKKENTVSRPPSHNQDHIIAERKRREKLSQRFIALSAIVPGLQKMDKASILGDTIKYLKQLQERVKVLEDQFAKIAIEPAVLTKNPSPPTDEDSSSTIDGVNVGHSPIESLPLIVVKASEKTVLVKVNCENRKGVITKLLTEIENLNLKVANVSAISFISSSLDVTITAQVDEGLSMSTVKEIAAKLKAAL